MRWKGTSSAGWASGSSTSRHESMDTARAAAHQFLAPLARLERLAHLAHHRACARLSRAGAAAGPARAERGRVRHARASRRTGAPWCARSSCTPTASPWCWRTPSPRGATSPASGAACAGWAAARWRRPSSPIRWWRARRWNSRASIAPSPVAAGAAGLRARLPRPRGAAFAFREAGAAAHRHRGLPARAPRPALRGA